MVGGEDDAASQPWGPRQPGNRKTYWRSASWSSSRSNLHHNLNSSPEEEKDCTDPVTKSGSNSGQNRRFPVPLTPRSQQNSKARLCLPPLQPLSIARRSLDEWPKASSDDIGEWPEPPTPSGRGEMNKSGERLKLDLSAIQQSSDRNVGLVKRDKIAFFDKECSRVEEHVYLGGDAVAKDRDILKQNGITHVLNCVGFVCPEYFKSDFVYRTLWLQDSPSEDITSILYDVFDYFEDVREQKGRVFVHCCQGVSRSTSLVIAYLMWREGQSFDDAFQYVKAARGIADPNMGFACQLLQCQKRVHAYPLSPSSSLRMYRLAPHSPYDPLHLVPKMLNDPSPTALDSRGAFIVHVPSAIYVWIGRKCELIMERDARGAVYQIVRYERVQAPIVMIKEGDEPTYFWDSFSSLLPLMEKSCDSVEIEKSSSKIIFPGERKVDSYNVDFEIFQKAISGGVVPPFASSETEHETHLPARENSWSALRRRFAVGNMKEFVSNPKLALSRVYSDSRLVVGFDNSVSTLFHCSVNSSSSTSQTPSSSSSPPYLSPDSILSNSSSNSSKYFSESPVVSPSTTSCSVSLSSTVPTFSNLSLRCSKSSRHPESNSPDLVDFNITSPSKKGHLSLAERRGSMSRPLKLPLLSNNSRVMDKPSHNDTCFSHELQDLGNDLESKDAVKSREGDLSEDCESRVSSVRVASANSKKDASVKIEESYRNYSGQPVICCWPNLEKISSFGKAHLDSRKAFVFFWPCSSLWKNEGRNLYIWIGKFFNQEKSQTLSDSKEVSGDQEEIGLKQQVGRDVLARMGLPEDTTIKIVKEGEEPCEFLALLSSL